jgi:hypothetical protein
MFTKAGRFSLLVALDDGTSYSERQNSRIIISIGPIPIRVNGSPADGRAPLFINHASQMLQSSLNQKWDSLIFRRVSNRMSYRLDFEPPRTKSAVQLEIGIVILFFASGLSSRAGQLLIPFAESPRRADKTRAPVLELLVFS